VQQPSRQQTATLLLSAQPLHQESFAHRCCYASLQPCLIMHRSTKPGQASQPKNEICASRYYRVAQVKRKSKARSSNSSNINNF
jgi:hypothetical protein